MGAQATANKLGIEVAAASRITQSFFDAFKQMKSWIMHIKRYVKPSQPYFLMVCAMNADAASLCLEYDNVYSTTFFTTDCGLIDLVLLALSRLCYPVQSSETPRLRRDAAGQAEILARNQLFRSRKSQLRRAAGCEQRYPGHC